MSDQPSGAPIPVQLSSFTVSDLTTISSNNRTTVMLEIVTYAHKIILDAVAAGRRNATADHVHLLSDWMNDPTFIVDLEDTLKGLFQGAHVEVFMDEVGRRRIYFSY